MRTKAHIEQGVANLVDIPAFEKAGMSPAEVEAERQKDDLEAFAALTLLSRGKDLPGDQTRSGDQPGSRRFRLVGIGIALVIMAVAIAIAGWWLFAGDDTPESSAGVAAPAAEPAPAPDAAQGGAAPGGEGCVLDESAVAVETALTETISKEGSAQTGYRGTAVFTNSSDIPIYLNLRRSQSVGDAPVEGWYDYQIPLAPGEVHTATLTGQSWTNRDPTWTVYTKYAAYPATDECRFQAGGDDALDVLARSVSNPLPVGPGS
jgi:hypothetical protein